MPRVLIVLGAGMNMRGKAQIDIFGPMTLPQYDEHIRKYASELGIEVEIFHSNLEGEVINKFYEAHDRGVDAAIINPAGYNHRPSRADDRDRAGALSHDRTSHLESGAAGQGVRDLARELRRGDRLRYLRVLPCFARYQGRAGWQVVLLNCVAADLRAQLQRLVYKGYFAMLKHGLIGTYHHVGAQHLQRYVEEFDFRFNTRTSLGHTDTERVPLLLKGSSGKRLTYY